MFEFQQQLIVLKGIIFISTI